MGAKVVAVHDHTGAIMNARGIDVAALRRHADATNKLGGFPGAEEVSPESFWGVDCDVMVPAAIENQITAKTGPLVRAEGRRRGRERPDDHDRGARAARAAASRSSPTSSRTRAA